MNKKGFTLVELLAVVVILGILMSIASPAVTGYLTSSRKSLFLDDASNNQEIASRDLILERFEAPSQDTDVTIISASLLEKEKNGSKSPFGKKYIENKSYVAIVNRGTPEDPVYSYYVALQDAGRNAVPLTNVESLEKEIFTRNAKNRMELTVQSFCGNEIGVSRSLYTIKGLEEIQPKDENGYLKNWNATIYSSYDCGRVS